MNKSRVWLFRGLTVIAIAAFVISWILPWWRTYIMETELLGSYMQINPWGLGTNLPVDYRPYYNAWMMPDWWAAFAWSLFGLMVAALLFSIFAKEKQLNIFGKIKMALPQLLIFVVGGLYVFTLVACVVVTYLRVNQFTPGFKLMGDTFISLGGALEGTMHAQYEIGWWVACAVAVILVLLALLRNKIIGAK
jgi:hypothetical protein